MTPATSLIDTPMSIAMSCATLPFSRAHDYVTTIVVPTHNRLPCCKMTSRVSSPKIRKSAAMGSRVAGDGIRAVSESS